MAKYFYSYNVTAAGMGDWIENDVADYSVANKKEVRDFEDRIAEEIKKRFKESYWNVNKSEPAWIKVTIISFQML